MKISILSNINLLAKRIWIIKSAAIFFVVSMAIFSATSVSYADTLSPPQNIGAEALCDPAVNIYWKEPNGQVQSYNIENVGVWGPKNTTDTSYADNAVSEDKYYIYDVTAVYSQGESEPASIFIKTPSEDDCENVNKARKAQSCPYNSDVANNKYALEFDATVWSKKPTGPIIPVSMPAGKYKVSLVSFDGYPKRSGPQPNERWYIALNNNKGTEITKTSPSTDLRDYVEYDYKNEVVDESLTIPDCVASTQAFSYGDKKTAHSVLAICGYFEKLDGKSSSCELSQPLSEPLSSSQSSANSITSVNCESSVDVANIGQDVVWDVYVVPPSNSYTYSWSGDENLSGSTKTVAKSYSTVGVKNGRVDVGGTGNPQQCTATVRVKVSPYFDEF